MGTQYETPKDQRSEQRPTHEQETLQQGLQPPEQPILPSPPPRQRKTARWLLMSALALVLVLALTLGTVLLVQQQQKPPTTQITPTPQASATPGLDTTATPSPGTTPGPQPGPTNVSNPTDWDALLGTQSGVNKVESVSFAHIINASSLQALVTVRYVGPDAKLDVYVFTNVTSAKPTQIFHLVGLAKGDAKISEYNTIMTAEVDKNSAVNSGKPFSAMKTDLFREFAWSSEENALTQVAFPGIFPDLTRYQAEADQAQVNQGKDTWKNNPSRVAKALVGQFFNWRRNVTTQLLSGGGPKDVSARVQVKEVLVSGGQNQGPNVIVTLSRLEGKTQNIWVAISVADGTMLQLTNIEPRQLIVSPVTLQGSGSAFEAVIGQAVVYDHLYTDIGHAQILGNEGMAQTSYTTRVIYTSSFRTGTQEGIVAAFENNGGISDEAFTAVMVKVLLDPAPGVALGPLPCPDAVKSPAYWTPFISIPPTPVVAEQVSCGNLFGNPSLQAMVVAREIVGGGPVFRSVFVFDHITSARPTLVFTIKHLLHGNAQISGYSSILTAGVDRDSKINAHKADAALTVDLFREFQWTQGAGTFLQVAFPGIYPDLTRYQAEMDQRNINNGQDVWKNDPAKVASSLATTFFGWKQQVITKVLSGGGPQDIDATVQVQKILTQNQGPTVVITLSRLEGNTHNMWVATEVKDGTAITLANIQPRTLISNPVKLEGKGDAFENTIGMAYILDHLYTSVGQAMLTGTPGVGLGNLPYSVQVSYDLSYKIGPQEGIVKIQQTSPIGAAPSVMVKVLLNPQQQVTQGPVSCPAAWQVSRAWDHVIGLNSTIGSVGTVSCANLKGDASLQALVPVYYGPSQSGISYVYDHLSSSQPVQLFKMQTESSTISGVSTVMTGDIDPNSSVNRGKNEDQMVLDLYREYQWSPSAGTFVQVIFPGLFPDMTRAQAEVDQITASQGQDTWKYNALQTTRRMFAAWFPSLSKESIITLISGGSPGDLKALVTITLPAQGGGSPRVTEVTLNRLEGNLNGIWEVTKVSAAWMAISTPQSGSTITSPVTVTGFGPWFEGQIGMVYILDHLSQHIQVGDTPAMVLDTNAHPGRFSLDVAYTSSFQKGAQEGFVELVHIGGASFDFGFVIVKVLLSA